MDGDGIDPSPNEGTKGLNEGVSPRVSLRFCRMLQLRESQVGLATVHRDHEPFRIPLNRPSGTFSPTGGEGWDEGEVRGER